MKIRAINANTEKYGYPQELDYGNPLFNGHQIGVAICVQNAITKKIEENFLSESLGDRETRDFLLGELLREEKAVFIVDNFTQFDENNELVPKTMYYMPYFVLEHSKFKPTVITKNIGNISNVSYKAKVEVLFVTENGLSRYVTLDFNTKNISVMDLVYDIFDGCSSYHPELEAVGIKYVNEIEDTETDEGYYLDFYNEAGERFNICFTTLEELRDVIASVRLIELESIIDGEEENEQA